MTAFQIIARVADIEKKLSPIEQRQAQDATQAHYQAIYTAHPDADSVVESQEFESWFKSQPTVARTAYSVALEKGSAREIVEVFDAFKKSAGTQAAVPQEADPAAVKAAA